MKKNPALRGAFDEAVGRAAKSKHNVLKTSVAADAVEDEELKENLRGLQDKQLEKFSVEGNWLVLGDKSSSMTASIDVARNVAATLSKMVKGQVWLVFFDTTPQTIPIPEGTALDAIQEATRYIQAQGNTSIGCGLQRMLDEKIEVDGIAIVSDGGENTAPYFSDVYKRYSAQFDKQVPVYFYQTTGDRPALIHNMEYAKLDMQVFDLTKGKIDYYSLPNLVKTMRTNRYSLIDEIMASRLLTLADGIVAKFQELGVEAPEWVGENTKAIHTEIKSKNRDRLAMKLKSAKARLETLKTPDEKRKTTEAEIAELERQLG